MLEFFRQVGLLLWKNFTLRKRQLRRNAVEILWPCAIFIILVSVREKKPPTFPNDKRPYHFVPRALPSAGLLPFMQSMFCNYRVNETVDSPVELPNFTNALFSNVIKDVSPLLSNETKRKTLSDFFTNFGRIADDIRRFVNETDTGLEFEIVDLFDDHASGERLFERLMPPKSAKSLLNSRIKVVDLVNLTYHFDWDLKKLNFSAMTNITQEAIRQFKKFSVNLCEDGGFEQIMVFPPKTDVEEVKKSMCTPLFVEMTALYLYPRRAQILNKLASIPTVREIITNLNNTRSDVTAAAAEIASLPSIQKIYRDVSEWTQQRNFSQRHMLKSFDIIEAVCGKTRRAGDRKIKNIPIPIFPSHKSANTTGNHTKKKGKEYPDHGGGYDAKCNIIHPRNRVDCGWGGITENQCLKLSCCWDSSINSAKYCFCPSSESSAPVPQGTCIKTIGGTSDGDCCMFPFMYKGVEHNSCTTADNSDKLWCFTAPGTKKWGNCLVTDILANEWADKANRYNSSCCVRRRLLVESFSLGSGYTAEIADFITRLLEGNVMYTPDNLKTREVVGRISQYLGSISKGYSSFKEIRPMLQRFLNATEYINDQKESIQKVDVLIKMIQSPTFLKAAEAVLEKYYPSAEKTLIEIQEFVKKYGSLYNSTYLDENHMKYLKQIIKLLLTTTEELDETMKCYNLSNFFRPVPSEKDLVTYAVSGKAGSFLSSIVFLNLNDSEPWPKRVAYKLRYNPDYTPSTSKVKANFWRPGPGPRGSANFWQYMYINFGFVFMQDLIERTFVEIMTNKTVYEPGIYIQQLPYPCFIEDNFIRVLGNFMPLFMTLAWVYTISMIVRGIVYEKELRLKEVMKVMGLSNAAHWTAWFIISLFSICISVICLLLLLRQGGILVHSDVSLVFFVLIVFGCASISMAFLISVFFSRANVSAACGGIIYFFTHLPYPVTLWFEESMVFSDKAGVSLFSTTAFGLAFKYISRWEVQGIGANWSNLFENPMPNDDFNVGWAVIFMLIDCCIYLTLTWYLEHVLPGQYGIPKPFYFPFTPSYWMAKRQSKINSKSVQCDEVPGYENPTLNSEFRELDGDDDLSPRSDASGKFEKEPTGLTVGIHIQNLVKVYKRGNKRAVNRLSLKMFENQVTALLGHNGAGKSTTMSVLTGLFPPTSGTAVVYGKDIRVDIKGVRQSLGLCPQHNVLFDQLTVAEHMWFYGRLKGLRGKELAAETERFLEDVGLTDKRNELSRNLSGGMKRKLSVAMAFIADSKTVILDEPTSGVDPASRRGIWDLILKSKQGRTILLSTHYMDEADLLGDRISIISEGKLQCCGTPLFLKRHFGKGYLLSLTQDPDSKNEFKLIDISNFIRTYVPSAELYEDMTSELKFVLPSSSRSTGEFTQLFKELETNMAAHGIQHYGISDTTLEEVFLKACDEDLSEEYDNNTGDNVSLTGPVQGRRLQFLDTASIASVNSEADLLPPSNMEHDFPEMDDLPPTHLYTGTRLCLQQFIALLVKRFHHARRSRRAFFSQIILPSIFVVLAMFVSLIRPPRTGEPSLKLSTKMYRRPNYVVVENSYVDQFSEKLMRSYVSNPGPGDECEASSCSGSDPFYHGNSTRFHNSTHHKTHDESDRQCSCGSGKMTCPRMRVKPPTNKAANGDTLIDLTAYNVTDYVLKTEDKYKRHRYGGGTFGDMLFSLPDVKVGEFISNMSASGFGVRRNTKVWYSLKGYHALPTYINMMNNAILRVNLDNVSEQDAAKYGIIAYNHPMDFNKEQLDDMAWRHAITDLFVAIFVILALAFVPASFLVYLVSDRVSKSKHIQLVSGLHPVIYWCGNYAWDMVNYLLPAASVVIIFLAFNQQAYVSSENFPVTFLLLLLYGWSMTPLMYPFSFYFDVSSTAYIVMIAANLFVGIVGTIATFILEYFEDSDAELKLVNMILKKALLIFPNYCLGRGLMDLAKNHLKASLYNRFGSGRKHLHPLDWELCGKNVFAMVLLGFIYLGITLLFQYNFLLKPRRVRVKSNRNEEDEEDVANEGHRIAEAESNGRKFMLKTRDLSKVYQNRIGGKKTLAVDKLTFGVQKGECFGLLGVNGAGKTSTFKMLTGDSSITSGDAFVNDQSLYNNWNVAHKYMGYCPQFDALDELLTGRELLMFYSQIRGMSKFDGVRMTSSVIKTLGLTPYADKICGDYSGGNKRKLSTAIAMLGRPPLILMDEPSTGMDPGARRFLWNVVSQLVRSGKSVVLTSHSMEECEVLCSRLAIMVNGVLKCIGSPQHLRSKYGTGYTIIIRAKPSHVDNVHDYVLTNFSGIHLKDRHMYMLEYHIPTRNLQLSEIFLRLETLKSSQVIDDYSVTQTTLDQIFVNFARNQVEAVQVASLTPEDENHIQLENCASMNPAV